MHITIITFGTYGDVQPYIALGLGLKGAGHEVSIATNRNYETIIRARGLNFKPVEGNFKGILQGKNGKSWLKSGGNPFTFMHRTSQIMCPLMHQLVTDSWNVCQDTELIICAMFGWYAAHHVAEKLKIPILGAHYAPITPTSAFPSTLWPTNINLGSLYNQLTYRISQEISWHLFRKSINKARRAILNLPPMSFMSPFEKLRKQCNPVLYGYSPLVIPKPPDWKEWIHVTGYWFLNRPSDWQPPSDLVDFLESGPPPVYIGFGSMTHRHPEQMTELVLKALKRTKQRGILQIGWGALSSRDLPDDVFKLDFIPFDWLFPKMAAVVHHGGAGTTSAGIRAGIPSIIAPFFADQFFWGQRVFMLGVGPQPIPQKHMSTERLSIAIDTAIKDTGMRARAANLGQRINAEDGVGQAVKILNHYLAG